MSDENCLRAIAVIYAHLGRDPTDWQDPTGPQLYADLGADSLDAIEITMELEDAFAIEITDAEAEAWTDRDRKPTVIDVWKVIKPKIAAVEGRPADG